MYGGPERRNRGDKGCPDRSEGLVPEEKEEEGITSILCVPIKAQEDVIGVLRSYSGVPRDFAREEILLAAAIAHQGGLAIRNASLYLMLKRGHAVPQG